MCGHGGYHERHGYGGCCCGPEAWGPGFRFGRRFATREERIARLEEYLKELQAEVKAVQERIAEMKAAG